MLNRTETPPLLPVDKIEFSNPKIFEISAKSKLIFVGNVPNETARVELYFNAGSSKGKNGIASFVNGLLLSGTNDKTSVQINAAIDALGGYFDPGITHENAVITVYSLRENMIKILRIIKEAIHELAFKEHEVQELLKDRKQKFNVNLGKVNVLAQRAFQERLFNNTAYGQIMQASDFENVSIADLLEFHRENYLQGLTKVAVVGDFSQDQIDEIIDITGDWSATQNTPYEKEIKNLKGETHVVKEDALQTAIRVGRILFNKTHEDYCDFMIVNTILGDYFGSRLMSNIREDKGYTYGIGSMVAELNETGYFIIATEVGKAVKDATLQEIRKEIERLQTEKVSTEELDLVKNYMLGQLLKSADGPYAMTDLYLNVEPYHLDLDFYNRFIDSIKSISTDRIMELANKYLHWKDMTVVSAG
jgi:zinc protease